MKISLLMALLLILPLAGQGQGVEAVWLVGFGGDAMLPLLDGGVLEVRLGEAVWLKLMGRNGTVTRASPEGDGGAHPLLDGHATPLPPFDRTGLWSITTDDGKTLKVRVEAPPENIPITLQTMIRSNGELEMTIQQPNRGYAFFEVIGDGSEIYNPGGEVILWLDDGLAGSFRVVLVRPGGPLTYQGLLGGRPYKVTIPPLVGVYELRAVDVGGRSGLVFRLPQWGAVGPGGLEPLRLGHYLVQVSVVRGEGYSLILERAISVVSPDLNPAILSSKVVLHPDTVHAGVPVVVGDDLGAVRRVVVLPPVAWLRVFDTVHGEYLNGLELEIDNADYGNVGNSILLAYWKTLTIDRYSSGETITPVRNATVRAIATGSRTEPAQIFLSPGARVDLPVQLFRLYLELVFPNGTIYDGVVALEVGR
ncbi:MAG: hypothetical protein QXX57_05375, partial [Nitrososphaerota archaeon]